MNYSVVRIETRTRESVGKFERHIERKNDTYANMNVDLERSHMNVHFRSTGDLTYNEHLDKRVAAGEVSLRGLKKDAKVFDEMILDVNSGYFEQHGGYDYAVQFYEHAFHFAESVYGAENIVSAVLHADEINTRLTEELGHPVYHYHLHVMALPVVEKKVLWTKRCKDPALVGTVKEVVNQISHSKKWASDKPLLDKQGQPVLQKNGKPKFVASYSILQDRFLDYMQAHGYMDIQRGERGSTAVHLSTLDYQIQQEKGRLSDLQDDRVDAEKVLEALHEQKDTASAELGRLHAQAEDAKVKLNALTPQITDIENFYRETIGSTDGSIPEPETFQSAKRYRKRLLPMVQKLRDLAVTLYHRLQELTRNYDRLFRKYMDTCRSNEDLRAENGRLRADAEDLSRVKRVLGEEAVEDAVDQALRDEGFNIPHRKPNLNRDAR